jgi:hypothetical protein
VKDVEARFEDIVECCISGDNSWVNLEDLEGSCFSSIVGREREHSEEGSPEQPAVE